jgi:DNA-binding response OmpR family regulator
MGARALICLDDSALTAALVTSLLNRGWECVTDDSLVGAVGLTAMHAPDLVLLDARADQVLRALKADARTTRATVVMIGADRDEERRKKALDAGALAHLGKSAGVEQLDTLTAFIEHGRSGAVEVTPANPPSRPAPAAHA